MIRKKMVPKIFVILACSMISTGLGFAYLILWCVPVYKAETRLYIQGTGIQNNQLAVASQERNFIATQSEVIDSPLVVAKALKTAPITVPPGYEKGEIYFALEQMNVAPVLETNVVSIGFRCNQPEEAIAFVKALVASYAEHIQTSETTVNSETLELLTAREAKIRLELAQLNEQHLSLRERSQLVGPTRDAVNVQAAMLRELAQKLIDARLKRIELSSRVDSLTHGPDETIVAALKPSLNDPDATKLLPDDRLITDSDSELLVIPGFFRNQGDAAAKSLLTLENQLINAQLKFQQLSQKFGVRHIDAKIAREQVAELETMFQRRFATLADALRREFVEAKLAEADLETLYEEERQKAKELDTFLIKDEKLRAEIKRTELIYETMLARLSDRQLAGQALSKGSASVIVRDLQNSEIHAELVWPQKKAFLAICAMIGLGGGFMFTFGLDAMRKHLSEPE